MDTEELELRFAFEGPIGDVLRQHVLQDAAGARLSGKFKTYYRLRPYIPIFMRRWLQRGRNQSMDVPDDWYVPHSFIKDFFDALDRQDLRQSVIHPWPDGYRYATVLTHDVETRTGVELIPALADLEEKYGFRSAWNFIPYKYKLDPGLVDDLISRGHEIGVHGYNHDGRLFESQRTFIKRSRLINQALPRFKTHGFRAPMVHRHLGWLQDLDIDFDGSCFDIDPFQAMPGGIGSPWPFIAGRFVELPYTLPQDHTLLVALGETTPQIWLDKLQRLRNISGMALLVTHPDYLDTPRRLDVYREFLEHLADNTDSWNTLPSEVAQWWRLRDASTVDAQESISGGAVNRGTVTSLSSLFCIADPH